MFRRRYTCALEDEVQRLREEVALLRAENRALVNSLLGTAGVPPLEVPGAEKQPEIPRLRRRSWHQIQTLRELAEARRQRVREAALAPAADTTKVM
jgi:hypothetical protein